MKYRFIVIAPLVVVGVLAYCTRNPTTAQDASDVKLSRTSDAHHADKPSGSMKLRMLPSDEHTDVGLPHDCDQNPPQEPSDSDYAGESDPPSFFGETITGSVIWILDVSDSMKSRDGEGATDPDGNVVTNPRRLDIVKFESIKVLRGVDEETRIAFVLLAGWPKELPITKVWKEELVACDDVTRREAIQFITDLSPWFGTPTHRALERACTEFGAEIDKLIVLSDGAPFPQSIDINGLTSDHNTSIMQDFPAWFAPLKANGCKLACIHIGQNPDGGFLLKFATAHGAEYIKR